MQTYNTPGKKAPCDEQIADQVMKQDTHISLSKDSNGNSHYQANNDFYVHKSQIDRRSYTKP